LRSLHSFPTRRSSDLGEDLADVTVVGETVEIEVTDQRGTDEGLTGDSAGARRCPVGAVGVGDGKIGGVGSDRGAVDASATPGPRSEEHTSELQSRSDL